MKVDVKQLAMILEKLPPVGIENYTLLECKLPVWPMMDCDCVPESGADIPLPSMITFTRDHPADDWQIEIPVSLP